MLLNNKGQAFSTFKLLIAAIVAVAILTILFQVLGLIKPPGVDDPIKASVDVLSAAYTSPASLKTSDGVNLSKEKSPIRARSIVLATESLGLPEDRLCFGSKGFSNIETLTVEKTKINYTGSTRKVKFSAICDTANSLENDITDFFEELDQGTTPSCPSTVDLANDTETACVIIVRTT